VHAAVVELDALADAVGAAEPRMTTLRGRVGAPPRTRPRRSSSGTACRPRTRRRRCRPSCRPAARPPSPRARADLDLGESRQPRELRRRRSPSRLARASSRRRQRGERAERRARASLSTISRGSGRGTTGRSRQPRAPRRRTAEAQRPPTCNSRSGGGDRRLRRSELGAASSVVARPRRVAVEPEPAAELERAQRLLQRLGKVRPIAITSPTDFIWVPSTSGRAGELLEGEARDLGHHVVDRSARSWRGLAW
jgi:hypothetical protein